MRDLPDEVFLNIGSHFTHLDRNRDLTNLALVSRRWRPIAQEWLLKEPRFNLTYIDQYMWELGHHSQLLGQVRTLEIWSTSEGRVRRNNRGISVKEYVPINAPLRLLLRQEMMQKCAAIVVHFSEKVEDADKWLAALRKDIVPALFGVLLCILPNLINLKLSNTWLMDFPMFSTLLSNDPRPSWYIPEAWKHDFLAGALAPVLPRLQYLEVPADMVAMYFPSRTTKIFDFRSFTTLKEIGVTMKALSGFGLGRFPLPEPEKIFPMTLEVLRISEASDITAEFLDNLCRAKKADHFPELRRVEVYHADSIHWTVSGARMHSHPRPVEDVRIMFNDAGLELYLYFPPWRLWTWEARGAPWKLKTEKEAFRRAELTCFSMEGVTMNGAVEDLFPTFEAEWDGDGDAVML